MCAEKVPADPSVAVTPDAVKEVEALGNVTVASNPGDVCRQVDTVVSMLPNDAVLRTVVRLYCLDRRLT